MKYQTIDELGHFDFGEAVIAEMKQMNGYFYAVLDNVTILPENSCNRDIRKMRTNNLTLKIQEGRIHTMTEEGYKIYNADGKLLEQKEDQVIAPEKYNDTLAALTECIIYSMEKREKEYTISIDTEDHTYRIALSGEKDVEEWERFFNLDSM